MPTTRQSCLAELAITSFFAFRRALDELLPIIPLLTPLLISDVQQSKMSHTESALQGTELRSELAPSQVEVGLKRHHGFVW